MSQEATRNCRRSAEGGPPAEVGRHRKKATSNRRRGNGEGSVYQRRDGTWCATYNAGYTPTGKRRRKTIFAATREAVADKLHKVLNDVATGRTVDAKRMTVGEFLDRWLTGSAKTAVKPTTYVNYGGVIKNHIKPHLGGVPLDKLAVLHVQGLYAAMDRAGKSAETIRLAHAVLHRALKQAVRWRLVPYNVCADVDRPRVAKADIVPLNRDQVVRLLEATAQHRLAALFTLAIASGMRLGEIFALQWPDVDLKARKIMVKHTLTELSGRLSLTEPKTARGRRCIHLPIVAAKSLKKHRRQMQDEGHGDVPWVFCDTKGGPLRRSHFHVQAFKPLLKAAGLPDIRFHDLRHTSATLLLSAGVHPKVVQERLGHSQISVTMDTYSHVLPGMQQEAAAKLDEMLSRRAQ